MPRRRSRWAEQRVDARLGRSLNVHRVCLDLDRAVERLAKMYLHDERVRGFLENQVVSSFAGSPRTERD